MSLTKEVVGNLLAFILALAVALFLWCTSADAATDRIETYRPMSFAMGGENGQSQSRYQISFALRVSNGLLNFPGGIVPPGRLLFGVDFSGIADNDTSFNFDGKQDFRPALFYRFDNTPAQFIGRVDAGIEHWSSGERDSLSNGFNVLYIETKSLIFEYDSLTVTLYLRPQLIIPWMYEPNTAGMRDLVTVGWRDFFPTGTLVVDMKDSRFAVSATRDSYTIDGAMRASTILGIAGNALSGTLGRMGVPFADLGLSRLSDNVRDRYNFQAFGRWHSGTMENIATYAREVDSWYAGIGFVPGW